MFAKKKKNVNFFLLPFKFVLLLFVFYTFITTIFIKHEITEFLNEWMNEWIIIITIPYIYIVLFWESPQPPPVEWINSWINKQNQGHIIVKKINQLLHYSF